MNRELETSMKRFKAGQDNYKKWKDTTSNCKKRTSDSPTQFLTLKLVNN